MPIRILIADDHVFYREGVRAMLGVLEGIEVIAEVDNGLAAIAQSLILKPDVILMDIKMPDLNGIDATRTLLEQSPDMRVLIVTMFDDDESVFAAMRAGARGYVLKDASLVELERAVRAVAGGEAIFSSTIASRMIHFFTASRGSPAQANLPYLTDREREVLALISGGVGNLEIADRLGISLKTVRNHVSNIYEKLQVTDRAQAALRAIDAGIR
jgi:DNA-binding NarL/FixJ family response regulator